MLQTIERMGVAQPSLRAIAEALDVQQTRIYSVAKQPVAGEVYDAKVYNWGAITRFVEKRIGEDNPKGFMTLEDVVNAALAIDAELSTRDRRRGPSAGGSSKDMIDVGGGKNIPKRKFEINVGDTVIIKKSDVIYKAVFVNDASVVLQPEDSLMLTSMSNWTLNQKMVPPSGVAKAEAEVRARLAATATATAEQTDAEA